MNVATLDMPIDVAHQRFLVYRDALRRMPLPEHEDNPDREPFKALMQAHKAVADGKQVINLTQVVQSAGWDDQGRPRLAVVRATSPIVYFNPHRGNWVFGSKLVDVGGWDWQDPTARGSEYRTVRVPAPERAPDRTNIAEAVAPSIPPEHRPRTGGLSRYHLLFEPVWSKAPDPDPMLIRHITGSLWVVLAVWDLTPIELAVLG